MSTLTHEVGKRHGWRYRACVKGKRLSIWIGPALPRDAEVWRRHCDAIIEANTDDLPIPRVTNEWLGRLPTRDRAKLQPLIQLQLSIPDWIDRYINSTAQNCTESTIDTRIDSLDLFAAAFANRRVEGLRREDLEDWRNSLLETRQPSTVGKISGHIKHFFEWLVEKRAIDASPAGSLQSAKAVGKKEFVDRSTIDRLLKSIDSAELRAAVALSRWAGIRIPSELCSMTIADFDFIEHRITIHDAKRGGDRIIPFFPELVQPIQEAVAGRAAHELLLPELANDPPSTLRSKLERELRKANIRVWPRIWHSMRATRETELAEQFGLKAASVWIGNSELIALRSYLLLPKTLFESAVKEKLYETIEFEDRALSQSKSL